MEWCNLINAVFAAPGPTWTGYDIARDFGAPLLIAILGFGGVIKTLRENARLAEEQHDRELKVRERIVRNGLFVELVHAKEALERNLAAISKLEDEDEFVFLSIPSPITMAASPELGLLKSLEVRAMYDAGKGIGWYRTRMLSVCCEGPDTTDNTVKVPREIVEKTPLTASTHKLVEVTLNCLEVPSDLSSLQIAKNEV